MLEQGTERHRRSAFARGGSRCLSKAATALVMSALLAPFDPKANSRGDNMKRRRGWTRIALIVALVAACKGAPSSPPDRGAPVRLNAPDVHPRDGAAVARLVDRDT